ncbi:MAG: hypothetical protein AAF772_16330, partial [Acidobacteriota bacterium]
MIRRTRAALFVRRTLCAALLLALALGCARAPDDDGAPDAQAAPLALADLLPFAEIRREVNVVDFGTPAARAHVVEGFSIDEGGDDDGAPPSLWSRGPRAALRVWLAEPRPLTLRLHLRGWLAPDAGPDARQTVALRWNEVELGTLALDGELRPYEIAVPIDAQRAGDNRLIARYSAARPTPLKTFFSTIDTHFEDLPVSYDCRL